MFLDAGHRTASPNLALLFVVVAIVALAVGALAGRCAVVVVGDGFAMAWLYLFLMIRPTIAIIMATGVMPMRHQLTSSRDIIEAAQQEINPASIETPILQERQCAADHTACQKLARRVQRGCANSRSAFGPRVTRAFWRQVLIRIRFTDLPVRKDSSSILAGDMLQQPREERKMRAWAPRRPGKPAKRRTRKRALITGITPPPPSPPLSPDIHYEAGFTDSWSHRRCLHKHKTLSEAAKCGMRYGCGWYVFCVEKGEARELHEAEDEIVNRYRFET